MNDQLALLPDAPPGAPPHAPTDARAGDKVSWELDDHTRHIGRRGLATARQALLQASSRLAA